MVDIYNAIKARLASKVPEVTFVRMWNNQTANGNEQPLSAKNLFIDFGEIPWRQMGSGLQDAELTILFRLVVQDYKDEDVDFFQVRDKIHRAFNGFNGPNWSSFTRVFEKPDEDDFQFYTYQMAYRCRYVDTNSNLGTLQKNAPTDLEFNKTLDNALATSDGFAIETSDGFGINP